MAVPLASRATGTLGNLQVAQMKAEMGTETILKEADATPYVTTWRNSNSRPTTGAGLALQEIFDPIEK